MNTAQSTAYWHPCLLAEETSHPRYAHRCGAGTLVLTINTGYE